MHELELNIQQRSKYILTFELLALFVALPTVLALVTSVKSVFGFLWIAAAICLIYLYKNPKFDNSLFWNRKAVCWQNMKPLLLRFLTGAALLTLCVYLFEPERLFNLPLERPRLWVMIMFLYPILSVYPQEIIFRSFIYFRYRVLFQSRSVAMIVNGLVFSYAHIFFLNWVSIVLCFIGGMLFANTYRRSRSLLLASIEHALYGCFVFTVGLGYYFYGGAARP